MTASGDFSRQSFLGEDSTAVLRRARVGVVGLGGGGSHIATQLAHVGVGRYLIVDPDSIEDSNLNRLIGGKATDIVKSVPKVNIARRVIRSVRPWAKVAMHIGPWQEIASQLAEVDILFGGVDGFAARGELEAFCRRYVIPYIDIGMDVVDEGQAHQIVGQVILSMPGGPCMKCMGFITDKALTNERPGYGDAGINPQVVWANGVLASAAVGIGVGLLCPWHPSVARQSYLEYEGNSQTLSVSEKAHYFPETCSHYA